MSPFLQRLLPPDPPFNPMVFTRRPVVHRFWVGGVISALIGFGMGFFLWAWQQGLLPVPAFYPHIKLWHARIQIILFAGSFLLGFALQSGPHVIGGTPPPARHLLRLLLPLWSGFVISLLFDGWLLTLGNLLVTLACLGAVYFLVRITLSGDPLRRLQRGIPLTISFLPLAISPWLALDNPDQALWVLWCGPVTSALVAGQQLIQNVLGGKLLQGNMARLFAGGLLAAWLVTTLAAFVNPAFWPWAGLAWVVVLALLLIGTDFLRAAAVFGLASINVTLVLGFAAALACAMWLAWSGPAPALDGPVHLLGAGMLTLLILGVAARVVSFFADRAALNDRLLCYLLLLWGLLALARVGTALGRPLPQPVLAGLILLGTLLLILWSTRLAISLWRISRKITPALLDQ
ncbi:MAG: NnrS family protein [Magnetococcus sp. DMHC-8]